MCRFILFLQIPTYCGSPEHRKQGLWRPIQKTVECMDQDCKDKPADERVMKCSGHASFEAHCGKNSKQHHWRTSFKVVLQHWYSDVDYLHKQAVTVQTFGYYTVLCLDVCKRNS